MVRFFRVVLVGACIVLAHIVAGCSDDEEVLHVPVSGLNYPIHHDIASVGSDSVLYVLDRNIQSVDQNFNYYAEAPRIVKYNLNTRDAMIVCDRCVAYCVHANGFAACDGFTVHVFNSAGDTMFTDSSSGYVGQLSSSSNKRYVAWYSAWSVDYPGISIVDTETLERVNIIAGQFCWLPDEDATLLVARPGGGDKVLQRYVLDEDGRWDAGPIWTSGPGTALLSFCMTRRGTLVLWLDGDQTFTSSVPTLVLPYRGEPIVEIAEGRICFVKHGGGESEGCGLIWVLDIDTGATDLITDYYQFLQL